MALPGSLYLYQGEELGLPEVLDLPDEARQDPIFRRSGGHRPRPGRLPGPAALAARCASYGFSMTEHPSSPWLPQPEWFGRFAVDAERDDQDSTYNLYRRSLALRSALWSAPDEPLQWLPTPGRDDVLAFARGRSACVAVCGEEPYEPPAQWGELVLASGRPAGRSLPGQSAAWLTLGAPTGD